MSETREIRYSTPETLPPAAGYSHVVETRGGEERSMYRDRYPWIRKDG